MRRLLSRAHRRFGHLVGNMFPILTILGDDVIFTLFLLFALFDKDDDLSPGPHRVDEAPDRF